MPGKNTPPDSNPLCSATAAYYLGELNALHPFREGNGRAQREFVSHIPSCFSGGNGSGKRPAGGGSGAPPVSAEVLTAQEWFERAVYASDPKEKIELYNTIIYLNPDFVAAAFFKRGTVRRAIGDVAGAQADYNQGIDLDPNYDAKPSTPGGIKW